MLKTILHIEVQLKPRENVAHLNTDVILEELVKWIPTQFERLDPGQKISGSRDHDAAAVTSNSMPFGYLIEQVSIVDFTGVPPDVGSWLVRDVSFDCVAFELCQPSSPVEASVDASVQPDHEEHETITNLPNESLHGVWDSLRYDPPIAAPLLRFLMRMMTIASTPGLNLSIMNFNKVVLLYGPPGTGKSSLCRALAQKLSIRLGPRYSTAKLIEVNCQSLLSKYFSESGKLVWDIFERIIGLAKSRKSLVCVVIDEIETLTSSRERSMNTNECTDALRATNQVLTCLDRMRNHPNVIVFCTSNLESTIDPAFLDRVDFKQLVLAPGPAARYEILRSSLNEMHRCGLILRDPTPSDWLTIDRVSAEGGKEAVEVAPVYKTNSTDFEPLEDSAHAVDWFSSRPESAEVRLWVLATKVEGFSGRALRRLPFTSIAMRISTKDCTMSEALHALRSTIEDEIASAGNKI